MADTNNVAASKRYLFKMPLTRQPFAVREKHRWWLLFAHDSIYLLRPKCSAAIHFIGSFFFAQLSRSSVHGVRWNGIFLLHVLFALSAVPNKAIFQFMVVFFLLDFGVSSVMWSTILGAWLTSVVFCYIVASIILRLLWLFLYVLFHFTMNHLFLYILEFCVEDWRICKNVLEYKK